MAQIQSPRKYELLPSQDHLSSSEDEEVMGGGGVVLAGGSDPMKEIELLRSQLMERDAHISMLEEDYTKCSAQLMDMDRQLMVWREKYDRLYESHKRVQKINQNLEDKLLQMADKCSVDKSQLARDIEILSLRLAESNHNIASLHKENERYKNDMNLAIQLLQCRPEHFVSQKFDSLPLETQARVSSYIMSKAKSEMSPTLAGKGKSVTTPEKINHQEFDFNISTSLMSKILEESVQNTVSKHCDTCTCLKKSLNPFALKENKCSVGTQTNKIDVVCPNCNPLPTPNPTRPSILTPISPLTPITPMTPTSNANPMEISEVMEVKSIPEKKSATIATSPPLPKPNIKPIISNVEPTTVLIHQSQNTSPVNNQSVKQCTKPLEESTKVVSLKHKEIMDKIGENLNEMNVKHDYKFPSIEPMSGHHRLCERTKHHTFQSADIDCTYPKLEEVKPSVDVQPCKPVVHSPKLVSTIKMADDIDVSFSQIEITTSIPNNLEQRQHSVNIPKSKSDLNYVETPKTLHNSSISSNDAESKTSSSRSWKNSGSYTGSNKVHIGPGPRFCSLRMQAGSKNILLDNAQPNIAPILYTRTRSFDTSPMIDNELTAQDKKDNKLSYPGHFGNIKIVYPNAPNNEEIIPILDMPNEDLPLSKPIQVEKPESGYKSNDSAEIIDKLLFGIDTVIQDGVKEALVGDLESQVAGLKTAIGEALKEKSALEATKEKQMENIANKIDLNASRAETVKLDRREALQNMKVFNFDQYERNNLRMHQAKLFPSHKMMVNYGSGKVPGGAQLILPSEKKTEIIEDIISPTGDRVVNKNGSEGNKKLVRNIANQTQPEPVGNRESREAEKSSSSLSSDDSAAVLQKQQLIRVAEWVQKNLEMEHHMDVENSDSCQQSVEELHHVRNDFPRPAKVDHRTRKAGLKVGHKSSHHSSSKHASNQKLDEAKVAPNSEREGKVSMVMGNWDADATIEIGSQSTVTNYTTRSYSREELARMEYNVKQFLLNGTRWTSLDSAGCKEARTSSKTETDL